MHTRLIEQIEDNFRHQKQTKEYISELLGHIRNPNVFTEWIYGNKRQIAAKVRKKVALLKRLKAINERSISMLLKENKSK